MDNENEGGEGGRVRPPGTYEAVIAPVGKAIPDLARPPACHITVRPFLSIEPGNRRLSMAVGGCKQPPGCRVRCLKTI